MELVVSQAEEEARSLQKKIQTIENDLDQTQEQLTQVMGKLEEKEKALQNVSNILNSLRSFELIPLQIFASAVSHAIFLLIL